MEETKKPASNSKNSVFLAEKSEGKAMLQMMNVVIADRERKRDQKEKFKLRRDKDKGKT
jgi:hypothetical protein